MGHVQEYSVVGIVQDPGTSREDLDCSGLWRSARRPWPVLELDDLRLDRRPLPHPRDQRIFRAESVRDGRSIRWQWRLSVVARQSRYFFITRYGDLGCDCSRYTLVLYDARKLSSVLRSSVLRQWTPTPLKELTFETTASNEFMVARAALDRRGTLLFVGVRDGHRQLFRLSASSGSLEQLTHASYVG